MLKFQSPYPILFIATLTFQAAALSERSPSILLDRDALLRLKPRVDTTNACPSLLSTNPLGRLFDRQAGLCKDGMSPCDETPRSCCPTGGSCCINPSSQNVNACCAPKMKCCQAPGYTVGCCDISDECDYTQGQSACCPIGQTCIACSDPSDIPCPDADFCCPAGFTCDAGANFTSPSCISSTTTSRLPPSASHNTFTPIPTSTNATLKTRTFTQSFPPTPSHGLVNDTVSCNSPAITYNTGDWSNSTSCAEPSMKASAVGSTMTCQFHGTALYLTAVIGPSAGVFTISIDGVASVVDLYSSIAESTCGIKFSQWGIANSMHNVSLSFNGPSPNAPQGALATFEYTNLIYSEIEGDDDDDDGASSSASQPTPTPSGSSSALLNYHCILQAVFASWAVASCSALLF